MPDGTEDQCRVGYGFSTSSITFGYRSSLLSISFLVAQGA